MASTFSFLFLYLLGLTFHVHVITNCLGGGEAPYAPEALGFGGEAKSSGKYGTILHPFTYSFNNITIFL